MLFGLEKYPGFLGLTSKGVTLIHADWPAYPQEHGWEVALSSLGQFPKGSIFTELSDIDQCYLFVVGSSVGLKDPFSEQHFHVAAWHEDLDQLHRGGLISGAEHIPLREWIERRRRELSGAFYVWNGKRIPVRLPTIEDFTYGPDDEDPIHY